MGNFVYLIGNDYGPAPNSTMGEQRKSSFYLRINTLEEWMQLMSM